MIDNGIIEKASNHSFEETLQKVLDFLAARAVKVFTVVDHSGEAAAVGLHMPPTRLIIFGNPRGGTPLMLARTSIALDLPLKILIREDQQGSTWVAYNSPAYLAERHHLPPSLVQNIAFVETLAAHAIA